MASTWSFLSRSRTRRIASRPTSSLSPHSNTGSPVTLASSTSSVKSAKGRLWAPLGAVKAIRPAVAKIAASFSPSARQIAVALDGSTGSNRLSCQPSPVTPGLRLLSGLRQCRPRWPSARWYWIDDPEGVSIPLRYSEAANGLTGGNVSTLMVGRGRGAGGGIQGIDGDLLRFSAARMSDWEHPCDQHLAQARSPMKPTETDGFFPWWTGHFKRLVPCPATSCGVK